MNRHVILVGLPGAGKTTVGRLAVQVLATDYADPVDYTDLDEAVEREAGRSIVEIFARSGELEFRRLERGAMERALARPPHLIAAGAGWIAQPGNLPAARARRARVVYLRVPPSVAAGRLGEAASRPLLQGPDPAARLEQLLAEREPWYHQADAEVNAEADLLTVATRVVELARMGERA